ncbi:MAG: outer membrane lipoprotein carrier protein LolA [Meiothermus sp.]|nr:outer membrane lipoprotein carrier protein LolA [Meiothermus sp.]
MQNAKRTTLKILGLLALSAVGLQLSAFAQTIADISRQVQANLDRSPWEAVITGKVSLPDGSSQDAEFRLQVLPGKDQITRVEFRKPASLEGNFVVISNAEVWNYLFLTNQLIVQPRARARIEGIGVNLTDLGDFDQLTERVTLRLNGEVGTSGGAAWRIQGTPKDATQGWASMELLVLKSDPRPVSVMLRDSAGKTVADLDFSGFKRTNLTARDLRRRPADAEVVRR